ncbi:MAG TPA: hypothetical protein VIH99_13655 [Bdellovibrionota bacterium]|jgi:hypothetical protein
MKKTYYIYALLFVCGAAYASSTLYEEFRRRENIRLTQEQGNAINFLKLMKYNVDRIEELELVDPTGATFVVRDRDDLVCFGDSSAKMLRCKNKIGLTTVTFDGDAD